MPSLDDKIEFLKNDFIIRLQTLSSDKKGDWGIMNAQQMVEHFADAVKSANGKLVIPIYTPAEHLARLKKFLLSDAPFKENTNNPIMDPKGYPLRKPDMQSAVEKVKAELYDFFSHFKNDSSLKTQNPIFGELNFEENVQLLYKHAVHHLRQFGVHAEVNKILNQP